MSSSGNRKRSEKSPETEPKPFWGEEIILEVYPKIQAFIFARVGPERGEDVLQSAMEGIIRGIDRTEARNRTHLFGWCYRIARNKLNDFYRDKCNGIVEYVDLEEIGNLIESENPSGDVPSGFFHDLEFLLKRIRHARFPCAEMLRDHYLAGVSFEEMAELYNVTLNTVRMRTKRCLEAAAALAKKEK